MKSIIGTRVFSAKFFEYVAIKDSPTEEHVHATQILKGKVYQVAKSNQPGFVTVKGWFGNSLGGKRQLEQDLPLEKVNLYLRRNF